MHLTSPGGYHAATSGSDSGETRGSSALSCGYRLPELGRFVGTNVQVGRYASLLAAPTEAQTNLLSKMVTVKLPSRVKTVGGAVQHLLRGSGYRLAGTSSAEPARFDLLNFPLPTARRSLGPMSLHEALETLGGPAFRLVEPSPPVGLVRALRILADTVPQAIDFRTGGNTHGDRHWRHPIGRRIRARAQHRRPRRDPVSRRPRDATAHNSFLSTDCRYRFRGPSSGT